MDGMLLRRDHFIKIKKSGQTLKPNSERDTQAVEISRLQEMILGRKFNRVSEGVCSFLNFA